MSQVRLTLRPPPNVDFIHGYPGIPPGAPERPQAAVKGALEVRAAPAVKAKWVRIELRKIEILPGGGLNNTYYDFVGPSPVNLWVANEGEDYSDLNSLDFPFSIRIPESVPPSLSLDNRAAVKYELLASVCMKGKRSFLRRRKDNVMSTQAPIIIDKHELHSTWPIYCQPETRGVTSEGVTLTVDRNHTCFGPGDRVVLSATVKSDAMHTIILRGFEITIKEQMTFRPGRQTSGGMSLGGGGKKNAPQVTVSNIAEAKFPVNATLFGGMTHNMELACQIDPNHTTTTLNSARHIDITYILQVQALMGTGAHLKMDLPIILSNWQRNVSQEAVRRIGPTPNLSLHTSNNNVDGVLAAARTGETPPSHIQTFQQAQSHARSDSFSSATSGSTPQQVGGGYQSKTAPVGGQHKTTSSKNSLDEFGVVRTGAGGSSSTSGVGGRRPGSAGGGDKSDQRQPNQTPAATKAWLSAEEEKQKLYDRARQQAERTQTLAAKAQAQAAQSPPANVKSPTKSTPWPTAEEEKMRLFNEAQAAARKNHGMEYENSAGGSNLTSSSPPLPVEQPSPPRSNNNTPNAPQYRSAEAEKAALRRYYEAKQAVDRTAAGGYEPVSGPAPINGLSGPVAYDSLYPQQPSSSPPAGGDLPPPFEASPVKDAKTALDEKMRLKKQYEAQDAMRSPPPFEASPVKDAKTALDEKMRLRKQYEMQDALARQETPPYAPPPAFSSSSASPPSSASAEKEMLRRRFEAAQQAANGTPTPPPRKNSTSSTRGSRPTPAPPSGSKVMTAAEEKAMLRARYESDDRRPSPKPVSVNGNYTVSPSSSAPSTPPAPPPLAPRPPASYIQETQEEDARVSRFALAVDGTIPPDEEYLHGGFSRSPSASIRSPPGPPPPSSSR